MTIHLDVAAVRLQYFDPRAGQRGSDKFYDTYLYGGATISGYILYRQWGRTGTDGQRLLERYNALVDAEAAELRIRNEKLAKGYRMTAHTTVSYDGDDVLGRVITVCGNALTAIASGSVYDEHRNMEKYGVTTLISEDTFI